ncbi:hypothetical protein [Crocosphaera chwakensis]|uniref:NAD/NADP transhydrogenase beta subunit n=1 Tax=Crocosphaera chwakensis CCY0110 TaxID=391612 RepID=A3IXB8_9CHRO|nr:hypothetical protein [Crocosphaera chwakensis]EAZ88861.1 hypothetical protein CY0110_31245 [Crocosphaera chwakensis CCY0110]
MWVLANVQQAQTILQGSNTAQQAVSQSMNQLWNDTLNSSMYQAIAEIGVVFFTGTFAIFLYYWVKGLLEDGNNFAPWEQWILLAVAIALLANQGSFMRDLTFSMRDLMNATSQQVLQSSLSGNNLISAFNQISSGTGVQSWYNQQVQTCQAIPDPVQQQKCVDDARVMAQQFAQQQGSGNLLNQSGFLSGFGSAIETALVGFLLALGVAVQWLVEICWILTAFAGPIAVGGTLLPVKQKSLFAWLIAFYSIGLYQLFFNILVGMVAMVMMRSSLNNLVFAVSVGLLSPILALVLAAGGGLATLTSLASIGGAVAGAVASGGASLALGGATMAGRMAAHPAMRRMGSAYQNNVPSSVRKRIRGRVQDATTPVFSKK